MSMEKTQNEFSFISAEEALAEIQKVIPDAYIDNSRINLNEGGVVFGCDIECRLPRYRVEAIISSLATYRDHVALGMPWREYWQQ